MCLCSLMLTYGEVDLAAAHHVVQEGVLSHQLQTQKQGHSVNERIPHESGFIIKDTITMILHTCIDFKCKNPLQVAATHKSMSEA